MPVLVTGIHDFSCCSGIVGDEKDVGNRPKADHDDLVC